MKKLSFFTSLLACTLIASSCFAKNVTVSGYGISERDARLDALRCAIERGMGVLIDSKTWVDKSVVVEDTIISRSHGFVNDYSIIDKKFDGTSWVVRINADVNEQASPQLMSALTRENLIGDIGDPRIAVLVPETHIRYRVPDPAGQTAIEKSFIEAGFNNVVDISQQRYNLNRPGTLSTTELQNLADSMRADILITGEAFSEGVGDVGRFLPGGGTSNMVSCRARVEAKMFVARTGQVLASDGRYGSAIDISEAVASKKALANAGEELGKYFVERMMTLASKANQETELVVLASSFQHANAIKKALDSTPGVKNARLKNYEGGRAKFALNFSGTPQQLFNMLEKNASCKVMLKSTNYNTLTIAAF